MSPTLHHVMQFHESARGPRISQARCCCRVLLRRPFITILTICIGPACSLQRKLCFPPPLPSARPGRVGTAACTWPYELLLGTIRAYVVAPDLVWQRQSSTTYVLFSSPPLLDHERLLSPSWSQGHMGHITVRLPRGALTTTSLSHWINPCIHTPVYTPCVHPVCTPCQARTTWRLAASLLTWPSEPRPPWLSIPILVSKLVAKTETPPPCPP